MHATEIGDLGDVLGDIGDGILTIEDFQQVTPLHGHAQALGEMAASIDSEAGISSYVT